MAGYKAQIRCLLDVNAKIVNAHPGVVAQRRIQRVQVHVDAKVNARSKFYRKNIFIE